MFKANYQLTSKLLENISAIERLYGQLESQTIPKELLLNLENTNLIKSSYSSNSIEGNSLSEAEVTNLILGDRVPANRDEKEVKNYFEILQQIGHAYKELDLTTILSIHRYLLTGVQDEIAGNIRDKKVVIGNKVNNQENVIIKHEPPSHKKQKIERSLTELLNWTKEAKDLAILKAGIYHHQFVHIHPFIDGNGRTCRLTTTLLLQNLGYSINKYFILDDYYDIDRIQYSDALHSADAGNSTEWLEYFTDGVKYSLQSSLAKVEEGIKNISFDLRPTKKETEVLQYLKKYKEVTSSQIAQEFKISRQQAFNLLDGLISKGFIEKFGSTKNSYYVIKQ